MEEIYLDKFKRARKGHGRRSRICSVRIPEPVKNRLDIWKSAYERYSGQNVSYEQMLLRWMDNIGEKGLWDKDIRDIVDMDPRINVFNNKNDLVAYLNRKGKFWEFCNKAPEDIADEIIISKSLLYLEYEDIPQLFDIFGKDVCWAVFRDKIKSQGSYYSKISFALEKLFFSTYVNK